MRPIDALPFVVTLMSAGTLANFLQVRTAAESLTLLTRNWDNASHFDMYYMLRAKGRIIGALANAPDGSPWHFYNYPQGFHASVTFLAELVRGPMASDVDGELVSYTTLSAVASIMAATLVASALCSIPIFRRRAAVSAPMVILVAAGWVFGPGAAATMNGFQNFYVAVALVAAFVVLMTLQVRYFQPVTLCAAMAAAVGVAHNWALLGTLLVGACAMFVLPWRKARLATSRRGAYLATCIATFGILAVLPALAQLSSIAPDDVLYAVGGVPGPDYGTAVLIIIGAIGVSVWAHDLYGRGQPGSAVNQVRRMAAGVWVVLGGLTVVAYMVSAQISKTGSLSYYSIKYIIALELTALIVLAMGVVSLSSLIPAGRRRSLWPQTLSTLLLMIAATQAFGLTLGTRSLGLTPSSTSAIQFEQQSDSTEAPVPRHVEALLRAAEVESGFDGAYLTTHGQEFDAVLAFQWHKALTLTYTEKSVELMPLLLPLASGHEQLDAVVRAVRDADPKVRIIVDSEDDQVAREVLGGSR
jgi:hypothetical protein